MSNLTLQQSAISQLAAQADAVGKLAEDTGAFAATIAAFESNDPDAFRWVLQRLELLPRCELICEWIRVKLCGLRCVEVCGPLDPKVELPDLPEFARALSQLASNEAVLRRVVDAVSCGDADSYQAAIADVKLQRFCHLICRYVCSIYYRRICEVVCTGLLVPVSDPVLDIRADAEILSKVFENRDLSAVIGKAAIALDCDLLRQELVRFQVVDHCEIICRLSCAWRCVWVCRALCLEPPVIFRGTYAVEEARNFALAARQLAGQPRALSDLTAAVISNNAEAFRVVVDRYRLGPYCWQVCGWVCSEVCYWYCVCVCPPTVLPPVWDRIGYIHVPSDIDGTGKTTIERSGAGGVGYAFLGSLNLTGSCPATSTITPNAPMMYRFMYSVNGGATKPVIDGMLDPRPFSVADLPPDPLWPPHDINNKTVAGPPVSALGSVYVCNHVDVPFVAPVSPAVRPPPNVGDPWYEPSVYVWPDPVTGWVSVYQGTYLGLFTGFMQLNSVNIVAGADPNTGFPPPIGAIPVPLASQLSGSNVTLTFEATRVMNPSPADYNQAPEMIRVNNNTEVHQLTLGQFAGPQGCCTPITSQCTVLFSVDHEEIGTGDWSLRILSQSNISGCQASGMICSPSAPGDITPSFASPNRGGSGSVIENTSGWDPCSYQVLLCTAPRLTDGISNAGATPILVTFCICGH